MQTCLFTKCARNVYFSLRWPRFLSAKYVTYSQRKCLHGKRVQLAQLAFMLSNLYMHGTKVFCQNSLTMFSSTLVTYVIIAPGMRPNKISTNFEEIINIGKQMISYMVIDLWQEIPYKFKDLNLFAFSKSVKNYILSQQYQT